MKTKLIVGLTLLSLVLAACGGGETAAQPQAESQPIEIPTLTVPAPTATSAPTEASMPATEAPAVEVPAVDGVSFANDVMPIFENNCIGCHGGDQTRAGLDLKTYESLMAGSVNGAVVVPENPAESWLVKLVADGKMPKRGPKLTPEQVQMISDWVTAGALNN